MRKGWEIKNLGDCFKLRSGELLTAKMMNSNGSYPVYGGNGISGYHDQFNLSGSNVIVGRVGALCGNVRHMTEDIWLTDNGFQVIDYKIQFDHAFLTYLLNYKNLRSFARQSAQPVISNSSLTDVVLEFPKNVTEQQRIVATLDDAFEAINQAKANTEKNLQNAKELFQSELNSIFTNKGEGWVEKNLSECFKLKSGEMLSAKMMKDGSFPVYGGNGISGFHNDYNLSGSNVIVGRVGALCGNVRHIKEKIWLTDNGFQLTDFKFEFDNAFLTYLLNYKNLRSLARQAAQPVISNSSLKDLTLQFPNSLSVQNQIVKQLDTLSAKTPDLSLLVRYF